MADTFEPNTVIYFKGKPIVWGVFFYHVRVPETKFSAKYQRFWIFLISSYLKQNSVPKKWDNIKKGTWFGFQCQTLVLSFGRTLNKTGDGMVTGQGAAKIVTCAR